MLVFGSRTVAAVRDFSFSCIRLRRPDFFRTRFVLCVPHCPCIDFPVFAFGRAVSARQFSRAVTYMHHTYRLDIVYREARSLVDYLLPLHRLQMFTALCDLHVMNFRHRLNNPRQRRCMTGL
jgi:hypothetical protein